ncbi:universal stress protein [Paenibacillus sp. R14(2021)]|uniref:universal stress protein n=1 Tax=Paenibacillus sp. R14(2021) TaxID=2859228 RepID=UPI001C613C26|nr:universal stress protein [Paenibacillus sp. R14(2021)]
MSFSHILVAYDGGLPSVRALDRAVEMAQHFPSAQLTVVHVYSTAAVAVADSIVTVPSSVQRQQMHEAQEMLKDAEAKIAQLPAARAVLLEGSSGESIIRYANEQGIDLIVMGSRGLGGIREFVMGSISHYMLQHAAMPLLIVK